MKKKALRKDFYMEIRKSLNRFLSILLIVALGVAFYSGIQSAAPDMRYSGDAYFDEHNLMDLKVIGTLGLTEDDVSALSAIRGISKAEPGYMTDVLCGVETQEVLHLESISPTLNQLTPAEGRLPEAPGECFLDIEFLDSSEYQIGDSITFYREEGDDLMLKRDTFTIVGAGSSPLYISFSRGNTTLGNGELSGVGYLLPEDFDSEVYTQIYLEVRGARDLTSYTDAYDTLIARVQEQIEGIEGARCEARYEEVMAEAESELADARQELADGKAEGESELADAREELQDARKELLDGKVDLYEAGAELAKGRQEWLDGKRELEENEDTVNKSEQELADGKAELADGRAQLEEGKRELAANEKKFQEEYGKAEKELNSGDKQLKKGKKELDDAKTQYASGLQQYNTGKAQYDAGEEQYAQGLQDYQIQAAAWPGQKQELQNQRAALAENQTQLETAIGQMNTKLGELQGQQAQTQAARDQAQQQLDAMAALAQQAEELNGQIQQLDGQIEEYNAQIAEQQAVLDEQNQKPEERDQAVIDAANQQIADYQAKISAANETRAVLAGQLDAANPQLEALRAAEPELTAGVAAADAGLAEIAAGIQKLQEELGTQNINLETVKGGIAQIDEGVAQGDAALAAAKQQLESTRAQLDATKKQLEASNKQLEKAKKEIDAGGKEISENEKKLSEGRAQLAEGQKQIDEAKQQIADNEQKLANAQAVITDGENQLADARAQLDEGREELDDARKEILDGQREWIKGLQEMRDGEREYADGCREYEDGVKEFDEEIADAEGKIADAEQEIADIKMPEWMVDDRSALPENIGYGENADRMRSLGQVFPVLFFLVAALISLTTMTRMVEEERTQIGTLKALGYGKISIASKYLCYALAATLAGSAIGILFGEKFLPFVIVTAYRIMYHHMPNVVLPYNMKFALVATGAALFSTMAGTLAACFKELAATPAILMRPPAPKEGKRVLLEHLPFLWKHISFSWKSTVRNLFRYKKRFFMTIFGISGCMALMLVGYGLRDSIMDVANLQFNDLQIYDGMVILDSEASQAEKQELTEAIAGDGRIERYASALMRSDTVKNGKKMWELYVMVPQDVEAFSEFMIFRDRETKESYKLTDEGAILTEKIAKMMGVKAGDMITVENEDLGEVQIPVAAVTENYLRHYIYLTPALYEKCFGEEPDYESILYCAKEDQKDQVTVLGEDFLNYDAALSVTYTGTIMAQLDDMLSALDSVIVVLIVSAGLLAFVVLYNLNNININERKRELATIKVLGFYDGEVSAYVYRENILLTIIGVIAGVGLGIILHRFTITTVEVDACMFGRNINLPSFLISAAFTAGFSVFVNVVMHFKLKKIDMVESLKSVE